MTHINIKGLVDNISERNNIYTPIIEAVVNSIQSIEDLKKEDGKIFIRLTRDQIPLELDENVTPNVTKIEIEDNGVGFNIKNRDSFDTLYSDQKIKLGGKGFGRFMFLKYYNNVKVDSIYKDKNKFFRRTFTFSGKSDNDKSLIDNEVNSEYPGNELKTSLVLGDIKEEQANKLDKKLETIARILVEKLLPYFINDKYKCPKIILEESGQSNQIILNDYFDVFEEIKLVTNKQFILKDDKFSGKFDLIIFKIYYSKSTSSVILTAHNRAVTSEPLHEYIPEFKDEFYDTFDTSKHSGDKNFSIKAYVLGNYLDKNVCLERDNFQFNHISNNSKLIYPFSKSDIESKAVSIVEETFKDELRSRKLRKIEKIKQYIDNKAPWHKSYFKELDLSKIPIQMDDVNLEGELQKQKFKKELNVTTKVTQILEDNEKEIPSKISEIYKEINDLGKSDLVHYVILRKTILDILNKSLSWDKDKKYEKEKVIHQLIFPMNSDSDHIPYDKHNLWIIDERLSFQEYIASDKPLNKLDERPDLLIFCRPIAVRDGDEPSNPITIFEFKKPQREEYTVEENPLDQIVEYIAKIRKGDFKNIDGRIIKANTNTPAYGYLICDLTDKIKKFCMQYDLTISPDKEGYFGFQRNYGIYLEVISFDKLIRDAELRNRIFFKKINLI